MMTYYHSVVNDHVADPNEFTYFVTFQSGKTGIIETAHGKFFSEEERDDDMARTLANGGYALPRWWQFWREDRNKLPARIVRRFEELVEDVDKVA